MKYLINLLLLLAVVGIAYLLVNGINEPIAFKAEQERRKNVVAERLSNIRDCQEIYRNIHGNFAPNFDTLIMSMKNDSIPFIQVFEDPEDPTNEDKYIYKTIYTNAMDSINSLGIELDSLPYVPFANNKKFDFFADTMTYQKTLVSITEVGTRWKTFMGKYGDVKYQRYDDRYEPEAMIKFGDQNSPNLSGNWE
jgi:hypothetical protein